MLSGFLAQLPMPPWWGGAGTILSVPSRAHTAGCPTIHPILSALGSGAAQSWATDELVSPLGEPTAWRKTDKEMDPADVPVRYPSLRLQLFFLPQVFLLCLPTPFPACPLSGAQHHNQLTPHLLRMPQEGFCTCCLHPNIFCTPLTDSRLPHRDCTVGRGAERELCSGSPRSWGQGQSGWAFLRRGALF